MNSFNFFKFADINQIVKVNKVYIKESLSGLAAVVEKNSGVFVIIDNKLKQFYKYFTQFNIIELETSERNKTVETVEKLVNELLSRGADRNALIIGVGGGITTDVAGFTASVYKRGVKFAFVPTTLLAQADASIGGKNGVNCSSYKNIIGTITRPEWVYVCSDVLKTLHPREFRAGVAEVLKTFVLFDETYYKIAVEYFAQLEAFLQRTGSYCDGDKIYKQAQLTEIVQKCVGYKCGVVERDEFERGERRLLNLGHTYAHAIEKVCAEQTDNIPAVKGDSVEGTDSHCYNGGIMHGEAVAIGMVLAAKVSRSMGLASDSFVQMLEQDIERVGLPVAVPQDETTGKPIEIKVLTEALKKDKKVEGAGIHFILPKALGEVLDVNVPLKELEEIAGDLC